MPLFAFLLTKPGCHSHVLTSCIFSQVPSAILNLTWNEEVRTQIYDQQGIDLSLNDDWHSFVVLRFRQCAVVVIISRHPHFVKPSLSIGLFPPQQKVSEPSNLLETLESKHRSTLNVFVFFLSMLHEISFTHCLSLVSFSFYAGICGECICKISYNFRPFALRLQGDCLIAFLHATFGNLKWKQIKTSHLQQNSRNPWLRNTDDSKTNVAFKNDVSALLQR